MSGRERIIPNVGPLYVNHGEAHKVGPQQEPQVPDVASVPGLENTEPGRCHFEEYNQCNTFGGLVLGSIVADFEIDLFITLVKYKMHILLQSLGSAALHL